MNDLLISARKSRKDLVVPSLATRLTGVLEDLILSGRAKPGSRIIEEDLAREFGISRSSLREAIVGLNTEFVRRFSLHVLPRRFGRIRHYGILSSSWKRGKLQDLQLDLKIQITEVKPKTLLKKCRCGKEGNLVTIALFGQRGPPQEYLFVTPTLSAK